MHLTGVLPRLDEWTCQQRHSPNREGTRLSLRTALPQPSRGPQWQATAMLPAVVDELVGRYLREVDLAAPGAIEGFYVVGSTALGAFRPGRSDVDFVAVIGGRAPRCRAEPVTAGAAAPVCARLGPYLPSTALAVAAHVQRSICQVGGLGPVTAEGSAYRLAQLVAVCSRRGIRRESGHMACAGRARHRRPGPIP